MAPEILDAPARPAQKSLPASGAAEALAQMAAPNPTLPTRASLPTDAILSLEQAAVLLGESLREVRNLTSVGLLKHQLIDGERCVWLSDLIDYKRDFDKRFAAWQANPLSQMPDDTPNPVDVLPEYAHMRRR